MKNINNKILYSNFLKPNNDKQFEYLENNYLAVDNLGKIENLESEISNIKNYSNREVLDFKNSIFLPGLIDIHTHIPQLPAIGIGKGRLLEWLNNYIFPLEIKFNDAEYSYQLSKHFFEECIKFGTTTLAAYSNFSKESTDMAFKAAQDSKIRVFIGMSCADQGVQNEIIKSKDKNISDTKELIQKWHLQSSGMLNYIITPRYAVICSVELMKKCAELASKECLLIQTHLSENISEIQKIKQLYPKAKNYADVYKMSGFMENRTIFAHCIYLNDDEIEMLEKAGSSIAHCSSSNRYLQSGIFNFNYINKKIKTGIGTDVAGGISLSMFNEIREAVETSKTLNIVAGMDTEILSPEETLWTATKQNSEILGLNATTGGIEQGLSADLIEIKLDRFNSFNKNLSIENLISKIIYILSNQFVDSTIIQGNLLYSSN